MLSSAVEITWNSLSPAVPRVSGAAANAPSDLSMRSFLFALVGFFRTCCESCCCLLGAAGLCSATVPSAAIVLRCCPPRLTTTSGMNRDPYICVISGINHACLNVRALSLYCLNSRKHMLIRRHLADPASSIL